MTERTYPGEVILPDGNEVDVWFVVGDGFIRLGSDEGDLGSWDPSEVRFLRVGSSMFDFAVDDEELRFRPDDGEAFDLLVIAVEQGTLPVLLGLSTPGYSSPGDAPADIWAAPTPEISVPVGDDLWGPLTEAPVVPPALEDPVDPNWIDAVAGYVGTLSYETPVISNVEGPGGALPPAEVPPPEGPDDFAGEEPLDDGVPRFGQRRGLRRQAVLPPGSAGEAEGLDLDGLSRSLRPGAPIDEPVPPDKLAQALEELVDRSVTDDNTPLTVGDSVSATQRLRASTKVSSDFPEHLKKIALILGMIFLVSGLLIGGWAAWSALSSSENGGRPVTTTVPDTTTTVPDATTTTVETSTTTTTTTTTIPPTAFDLPAQDFVRAWNEIARDQVPVLEIATLFPPGTFEMALTGYVTLSGEVESDSTLGPMTLIIDPSGPDSEDQVGLAAIGLLMRVIDPSTTGSQRRTLLARMGFDIDNPQITASLDGTVTANGITYRIRYDSASERLILDTRPQ